jgi:hypothetical protein
MNKDISKDVSIPVLTPNVIQFLNTLFPERCASLTESEKEIFFAAGQRSVVKYLNRLYEEQQECV